MIGSVLAKRSAARPFLARACSWTAADVQLHPHPAHSGLMRQLLQQDESVRDAWAYCLSFSSDEGDFQRNFAHLDDVMRSQIAYNQQHFAQRKIPVSHAKSWVPSVDDSPLPSLLSDALRPHKHQAIVITEPTKPFRIVEVNKRWEELCEYTYLECRGKTLGSLIGGPQTNINAATGLIAQLLRGEQAGTTLINYTKSGRRFCNRVQVGPLRDPLTGHVTHFVGVLQEVPEHYYQVV